MMQPPSPSLLISAATTYLGWDEDEEQKRFARRSAFVERMMVEMHAELTGQKPVPWHTAFVNHVGYWAHYDHEYGASSWPLPATASADELGMFAVERGVMREEPEEGDVFLLWGTAKQVFVRAGIVLTPGDHAVTIRGTPYQEVVVIEANTNEARSETGGSVLKHTRRLSKETGDRFVRWRELDVRAERMAAFLVRGSAEAERREAYRASQGPDERRKAYGVSCGAGREALENGGER